MWSQKHMGKAWVKHLNIWSWEYNLLYFFIHIKPICLSKNVAQGDIRGQFMLFCCCCVQPVLLFWGGRVCGFNCQFQPYWDVSQSDIHVTVVDRIHKSNFSWISNKNCWETLAPDIDFTLESYARDLGYRVKKNVVSHFSKKVGLSVVSAKNDCFSHLNPAKF